MALNPIRLIAFVGALLIASATAQAEEQWPDLRGTWQGHTQAVAVGNTTHHGNGSSETPRMVDTRFIIHINHQQGRRFSGNIESTHTTGQRVTFVGTFTNDQHHATIVDSDGTQQFRLISDNEFELCYTHSTSDGHAAGCGTFSRLLN
ncbi:MAG: hypothetical protein AAF414_07435 [Pseudomonadota bacterium]